MIGRSYLNNQQQPTVATEGNFNSNLYGSISVAMARNIELSSPIAECVKRDPQVPEQVSRGTFRLKYHLRIPLPPVKEDNSTCDETGKWRVPTCSHGNAHKPRRRGSLDNKTLRIPQALQSDTCERTRNAIINPAA